MERMRAQRRPDGRTATERDAVRPAPPPAAAVLALQLGVGNWAVTGLLQRIPLRRDLTPPQREQRAKDDSLDSASVAGALGGLPFSLVQRLIEDIGASTIRRVVTPRLLLGIAAAYGN